MVAHGERRGFYSCLAVVSCSWTSLFAIQVDGVSYLLQEIYGIENKYNTQDSKVSFVKNLAFVLPWRQSENLCSAEV